MKPQLDALLAALARSRQPEPSDLACALRELPEVGALPSPWDAWTLIGLSRHRQRQYWVANIIRTRLNGSGNDLATRYSFGHPHDIPGQGAVPGMPDWEYRFHGRGCCLTDKVNGVDIDVDFYDDSGDYFGAWFYTKYLESLRRPEAAEQRLLELHPTVSAISIALADLESVDALPPLEQSGAFRLADEVAAISDFIDAFCTSWAEPKRRLWLAALIGDWPAADREAQSSPALSAITKPRAEQCLLQRRQRLRRGLQDGSLASDSLRALADLQSPDLAECLEKALCAPPGSLVSAALKLIDRTDDPRWCVHVQRLFTRLNPGGELPSPYLWSTALRVLLRHGHRTAEMIPELEKAQRHAVSEAALLALEYAPQFALPLIRRALVSDIPCVRTEITAAMAIINLPWSMRELMRVLEVSNDHETTADARAALLEYGDEAARHAVLAWEQANPREKEAGHYVEVDGRTIGPLYSFAEHMLEDRLSWVNDEMSELHERVMKVRDVLPS